MSGNMLCFDSVNWWENRPQRLKWVLYIVITYSRVTSIWMGYIESHCCRLSASSTAPSPCLWHNFHYICLPSFFTWCFQHTVLFPPSPFLFSFTSTSIFDNVSPSIQYAYIISSNVFSLPRSFPTKILYKFLLYQSKHDGYLIQNSFM